MSKLERLAREAADLGRPDSELGHVDATISPSGTIRVRVYVSNPFAFPYCEHKDGHPALMDSGYGPFALIEESGDDLDTVIDQALARVQDAVAGTPAEQVA